MSESERDTKFHGFARRLWEEMLSQTAWDGIDVTAGHIPLHHPEDEEHTRYIDIIARRAYDLIFNGLKQYPLTDEEAHRHIARNFPDLAEWPIEPHNFL